MRFAASCTGVPPWASLLDRNSTYWQRGAPGGTPVQVRTWLIEIGLGSFDDLAGLQAASTHANSLSAAADESADALQVGIEAAIGAVVGVAHPVTKLRPLAADLTAF